MRLVLYHICQGQCCGMPLRLVKGNTRQYIHLSSNIQAWDHNCHNLFIMIINVGSRKSERNCFVPFFDGHGNRYHEFHVNECIFLLHCGVGAASLAALSESEGFPAA